MNNLEKFIATGCGSATEVDEYIKAEMQIRCETLLSNLCNFFKGAVEDHHSYAVVAIENYLMRNYDCRCGIMYYDYRGNLYVPVIEIATGEEILELKHNPVFEY